MGILSLPTTGTVSIILSSSLVLAAILCPLPRTQHFSPDLVPNLVNPSPPGAGFVSNDTEYDTAELRSIHLV